MKLRILSIALLFFAALSLQAADKKFTLVIDAGHGGKDAGAVGAISKEKNINLSVALAFGRYVERNCPDVRVIYTRKTDVFIPLEERANIANRNKADLFVSVHTNAVAGSKVVRGFETYTLGMHRAADNLDVAKRENSVITLEADYKNRYAGFDPNSAESYIMFEYMQDRNMENSVKFAKAVQSNVCSTAARLNKGVHQAGFLVLRETSMPSALVELGFISTPDEERQLNDPGVQDRMARGLYQAFESYRGKTVHVVEPIPVPDTRVVAQTEPVAASVKTDAPKVEPAKVEPQMTPLMSTTTDKPVFKVQILTGSKVLHEGDSQFKGLKGVGHYKESGMVKFTYGESTNYNEIVQLRKQILDKFPQAFIIAFKSGQKVKVNDAISEWKSKK